MPSLPRVAVCLVGEPRSIGLTAGNLRTNLLDAWDADGFVASTTDEGWARAVPDVVHCCALGEVTTEGGRER